MFPFRNQRAVKLRIGAEAARACTHSSGMNTTRSLKSRLASGPRAPAVGAWMALAHPGIAELLCAAGYDWVAIDLEHTTISLGEAEALIRVIDGRGVTPLVRLTSNDAQQIKRVLDAGAHGVIVPNIKSREELLRAFRAMHYPPRGERGVGLGRAQGYGASFQDYRAWLDEHAVLIAQVEHVDALANLEELFGSPELDAFLVGPYDLSASMGLAGQFEHPSFVAALAKIRAAAAAADKPAGYHVVEPDPEALRARVAEGYRLLAYSVDFRLLDVACRQGLRALGR
jgi:2-keto-3-deoxy-L-rhamnonate aldolase RhmA